MKIKFCSCASTVLYLLVVVSQFCLLLNAGGASAVAGGSAHTCSLQNNGAVSCWGANANGQLGLGGTASVSQPTSVNLKGMPIVFDGHEFL